jgi:hypothetical protein
VITICGVISGERYMQIWSRNPSEKYIANLRHDLDAAKGTVTMFDQAVPTSMMMASFEEGARLSHVTKPLPNQPRFVTWATTVKVADAEGKLRDGKVTGVTAPGKQLVCNRGRANTVTRKLPVSPIKWDWKVQIAYVANRETTAVVTVHDGRRPAAEAIPVKLTPGMRVLYVALLGGGDRVTVSGLQGGASVCLAQVSVGELVPTSPEDQPAE